MNFSKPDSIKYSINVIPDLYFLQFPLTKRKILFQVEIVFHGEVKDDYGFTGLAFVYHTLNKKDSTRKRN